MRALLRPGTRHAYNACPTSFLYSIVSPFFCQENTRLKPGGCWRLLGQQLGDLDGVGGGTLADLVAAAPQAQAVGIGQVGTDAADVDDILAGGVQGHGVLLGIQVIHQLDAGGPC